MRRIYFLIGVLICLMVGGLRGATAQTAYPILFTSERDGNQEIYSMDANGENVVNLTQHPANDWSPAWTPDGGRILFTSDRDGNAEIYSMNADGSDVRRLTNHPGADYAPVPHPLLTVEGVAAAPPPEASEPVATDAPPVAEAAPGVVPDLTGLNVPQAAAALNRNGLLLGNTSTVLWSALAPAPPGTVGSQSVPAGQNATAGSSVDIGVLQTTNGSLIWDDNDLTLVNNTGLALDLTTIRFSTLDGNPGAAFSASRWATDMRPNRCAQVWSVFRSTPKPIDECHLIQYNMSTTNTAEHFWTGANGATQFQVIQNDEVRATCQIADGRCEFYLQGVGEAEADVVVAEPMLDFIYFAYTPESFIVKNRSEDSWLSLATTLLHVNGATIPLGDPATYAGLSIIGDVTRLAPNQCILFGAARPPEACDVIVHVALPPTNLFWSNGFEVSQTTAEQRRACGIPKPDTLSLCILPH